MHMRGVGITNQLWASYLCQSRSHKWWQKVFDFLLDQMEVNMYVLYLGQVQLQTTIIPSIAHLGFKIKFFESLIVIHKQEPKLDLVDFGPSSHLYHIPQYTRLRRQCKACIAMQCHHYCSHCGIKFLCLNKGCFEQYHVVLWKRADCAQT